MENENQDLQKSKKRKIIIIIIVFLALFLLIGLLVGSNKEDKEGVERNNEEISFEEVSEDDKLTPEEVIARMNAEEGIGVEQGPVDVEIIGPEGEVFMLGQARHYQAQVLGLENGSRCSCNWKFYLNENNEEYLYKEMLDRGCSTKSSIEGKVCGFTSTFIEKIGELRVHVDVEVEKQGEVVQRAEVDRIYMVQ